MVASRGNAARTGDNEAADAEFDDLPKEPTMEEILASIREIITEDEKANNAAASERERYTYPRQHSNANIPSDAVLQSNESYSASVAANGREMDGRPDATAGPLKDDEDQQPFSKDSPPPRYEPYRLPSQSAAGRSEASPDRRDDDVNESFEVRLARLRQRTQLEREQRNREAVLPKRPDPAEDARAREARSRLARTVSEFRASESQKAEEDEKPISAAKRPPFDPFRKPSTAPAAEAPVAPAAGHSKSSADATMPTATVSPSVWDDGDVASDSKKESAPSAQTGSAEPSKREPVQIQVPPKMEPGQRRVPPVMPRPAQPVPKADDRAEATANDPARKIPEATETPARPVSPSSGLRGQGANDGGAKPNPMSVEVLTPGTDAAVAASFEEMATSLLREKSDDLNDMLEGMIRPHVRRWIDDNLATLVERVVRDEIERVSRGK